MKILLATDGSKCSENAARFLSYFNLSSDDEIIILHVIKQPLLSVMKGSHYSGINNLKSEIAPAILDVTAKSLGPVDAKVTSLKTEGPVDKSIIEKAVNAGADLIVMGARGIRGVKSLFIGSISRSVANNSPVPVLVTKPLPWEEKEALKVLFATDGSESAHATADLMVSLPFPENTVFTVMNVPYSASADIPERFFIEISDKIKEDVTKARTLEYEESGKIIKQTRLSLDKRFANIESLTKVGDPSIEILDQAEKMRADIIAVGHCGIFGSKGMMGSLTRRILGHSRCAVLVGKACEQKQML